MPLVDAEEAVWDFKSHFFLADTQDGGISNYISEINGKKLRLWKERSVKGTQFTEFGDWTLGRRAKSASGTTAKSTRSSRLRASCHCGGMTFWLTRPEGLESFPREDPSLLPKDTTKFFAVHDVCTSCRLISSSAFIPWIFVPRSLLSASHGSPWPSDDILGTAKVYQSSEKIKRTFCGTCGATASLMYSERPDFLDIAAGLLVVGDAEDEASGVRAEEWVEWRTSKIAWENDAVWRNVVASFKEALLNEAFPGSNKL